MRGRNSEIDTPTSALAATTFCSASRMSGRRSSSCAGTPAGTCGGVVLLEQRLPARDRSGLAAEQHRESVLDFDDAPLELGDRRRRGRERRLRAQHAELRVDAAGELALEQVAHLGERVDVLVRDLELEIEPEQLEVARRDVAHQRQHDAAPERLGRVQLRARGLVRAPDPAPDVDLPGHARREQERVVARRAGRGQAEHGVHAARRVELAVDLREELRARDARLRARFLDARRRDAARS